LVATVPKESVVPRPVLAAPHTCAGPVLCAAVLSTATAAAVFASSVFTDERLFLETRAGAEVNPYANAILAMFFSSDSFFRPLSSERIRELVS
jgi:hypothetical protein